LHDRMHAAHVRTVDQALEQRTISEHEAMRLRAAAEAVAAAIAVNDFAPEELTSRRDKGDVPSQATSQAQPAAAE
jgi:acyl-CoA dehydrogenase